MVHYTRLTFYAKVFAFGMLSLLLGSLNRIVAQVQPYFQYNVRDGLPASTIYECLQSSDGFLWLATEFGVSRFDGYRFKNYSVKDGLQVNDVWGLFEDSQQRIWIRSFSPYLSYIYKGEIKHIALPDSLHVSGVHYISEAQDGTLWFSFENALIQLDANNSLKRINYHEQGVGDAKFLQQDSSGLWFLRKDTILLLHSHGVTKWPLPIQSSAGVLDVVKAIDNEGWLLLMEDYILRFKPVGQNFEVFNTADLLGEGCRIEKITGYPKNLGQYWLLTNCGNVVLNPDLSLDSLNAYLPKTPFEFAYKDRESNLWLCGRGVGLNFFPAAALKTGMTNYYHTKNGESFRALCFLNLGEELLIGTYQGILKMDSSGSLKKISGSWKGVVREMFWDRVHDRIIVATERTLLYLPRKELHKIQEWEARLPVFRVEDKKCFQVYELSPQASIGMFVKNGSFHGHQELVVSAGNGIARIDFSRYKPSLELLSTKRSYANQPEDSAVWYGRTNGLGYIDPARKDHFPYTTDPLLQSSILDMEYGAQGVLWIASDGYGLFGYKPDNQSFFKVRELENDIVKRIVSGAPGHIWLATNKGICKLSVLSYSPFLYKTEIFSDSKGLVSGEVNALCFFKNKMVVGTHAGISIFDPALHLAGNHPPKMTVCKVVVDGKEQTIHSKTNLNYNQNDLTFYFSGLLFQESRELKYAYRLNGFSNQWNTTQESWANFHNLEPGQYSFEVGTLTENGMVSEQTASWNFEIHPHWTQMPLVRKGSVFLTVLIIFFLLLWWYRFHRDKLHFQKEISSLQAHALQAQMNPHFIFNALNSIQYMIGASKADEASEYLALFGRLIRLNIELSQERMVPLHKEIQCLELYLELEKMRFGKRLDVSLEVHRSISTGEVLVPGLILQPFIELFLAGRATVKDSLEFTRINIFPRESFIQINILNPGFNRLDALGKSVRIQALRKRITLLYAKYKNIDFIHISHLNQKNGIRIRLVLPLYQVRSESRVLNQMEE